MMHPLANARGIKHGFVDRVVTPPTTFVPSSTFETTATSPKVGQLTIVVTTLFMEDLSRHSPAPVKSEGGKKHKKWGFELGF